MSGTLKKDDNDYPVSGGVSTTDANAVLPFKVNPVNGRLQVQSSAAGGTGTWVKVTGTIDGVNATFTLAVAAGSDFLLFLNRAQQAQTVGADTWDYSYVAGGGITTITYVTPPDASLSGTPHQAFVVS